MTLLKSFDQFMKTTGPIDGNVTSHELYAAVIAFNQ